MPVMGGMVKIPEKIVNWCLTMGEPRGIISTCADIAANFAMQM